MMHHGSIARCSSVHSCISVIHVSIHFLCLQLQCVQEVNPEGGSYSEGGSSSSTVQVVNLEAETTPAGPPAKALPTNPRPPPSAPTVHTQPAATTVPPPPAPAAYCHRSLREPPASSPPNTQPVPSTAAAAACWRADGETSLCCSTCIAWYASGAATSPSTSSTPALWQS